MKRAAAFLLALAALPAGAVEVEILSRVPPRRASETALGESLPWAISADGRFLVFLSNAQNLVAGVADGNNGTDVFLFDRATGETELVSRSAGPAPATGNRESSAPAISTDGRFVAFESRATDLVSGIADTNGFDVFLYDRLSGKIVPVSRSAASPGRRANGPSFSPAISADGNVVVFTSRARDLVAGQNDRNGTSRLVTGVTDNNGDFGWDVFIHDRNSQTTTLLSRAVGAAEAVGGTLPQVSGSGRFVAFTSDSTQLVAGQVDGNNTHDTFLYDRESGEVILVSRAAGTEATAANRGGGSEEPQLSADGRILFASRSTDLVAGQSGPVAVNLFVFDRTTGETVLVSRSFASPTRMTATRFTLIAALAASGNAVAFSTDAPDLVPRDFNQQADAFVADLP